MIATKNNNFNIEINCMLLSLHNSKYVNKNNMRC